MHKHDLVENPDALILLWGLPPMLMLLSVCCAGTLGIGWIVTITWTLSLAVMGGACLYNARGCGRTHCYFTGPFFLLMAVASLVYGLNWMALGPYGWLYLGAVVLAGASLLYFVPERLWGRYWSMRTTSQRR